MRCGVLCAVARSWLRPPSIALRIRLLMTIPTESLHDRGNPACVGSSNPLRFETERLHPDAANRYLLLRREEPGDCRFPGVRLKPGFLLGLDVLSLERLVGPPLLTEAIEMHGLREQLVSVLVQPVDVDGADLDRPEPAAAGLVAEIACLVCSANEDALPWLNHLETPKARPIALDLARNKGLQEGALGAVHRVHLADFDQPLSPQILGNILSCRYNGQAVGKPF